MPRPPARKLKIVAYAFCWCQMSAIDYIEPATLRLVPAVC
jgi:hypothetical protein